MVTPPVTIRLSAFSLLFLCAVHGFGQQVYTTLSGFSDRHGPTSPQYFSIDPTSGRLHAIMQIQEDSVIAMLKTAYAMSTNGGTSWNNISNLRIGPTSRYPAIDARFGFAVVANCYVGAGVDVTTHVHLLDGAGFVTELPPLPGWADYLPLKPRIAIGGDSSIIIVAQRPFDSPVVPTTHIIRSSDFGMTWSGWYQIPVGDAVYQIAEGEGGTVGIVLGTEDGVYLYCSTDNGATWPASTTRIIPFPLIAGGDSLWMSSGLDIAYRGVEPTVTCAVTGRTSAGLPEHHTASIAFWSASTGLVLAVPPGATPGAVDTLLKPQAGLTPVCIPAVGASGDTMFIAFQAFMAETSSIGFNYSDIFLIRSFDQGASWTPPENLSRTNALDEQYVSLSHWSPPGRLSLLWLEDTIPGSPSGGAPFSEVKQVFSTRNLDVPVTMSLPVSEGWNLLSTPLCMSDPAIDAVYPTAISQAFSFEESSGYIAVDSVERSVACWIKFASDQQVMLEGRWCGSDTIAVHAGWNLIGTISHPVPVGSIQTIPPAILNSSFFGYRGSYQSAAVLQPGSGYWVQALQEGLVILR
jgi:hypothetical protein